MKKEITKYCIITFGWLAVLYPLWVRIQTLSWSFNFDTLLNNLFPLFGLTAFSLLWLHSIIGVIESWLKNYINVDNFVQVTATIILLCIILHPLLLFMSISFQLGDLFLIYESLYIWLGIIGWILLITYDIGKALKKYDFFVKQWNNILTISTIGFLLTFFHSLYLGSDLQSGPLRIIWIFYGVTAIISTIYTYGIKRFIKQ